MYIAGLITAMKPKMPYLSRGILDVKNLEW